MIKFRHGCVLDALDRGDIHAVMHVVNCQGVMGSGIAKQIKDRYPKVFSDYTEYLNRYGPDASFGTGFYSSLPEKSGTVAGVYNLFAQYNYGTDKRHLNYGKLASCLHKFDTKYIVGPFSPPLKIGIPYKMGCDRAGGDWEIVLEMIEAIIPYNQLYIYKLGGN